MVNNPNLPWVFPLLGYNNIGYEQLKVLRTFRNKFGLSDWQDFTQFAPWDVIKKNMDIPWVPEFINFKPGDISSEDDTEALEYFETLGYGLDWSKISFIADISVIRTHLHLPWDYRYVSTNASVKTSDLSNKTIPWNYNLVRLEDDATLARRWIAASRIQRHWKRCVSDPEHPICVRRLMYEFYSLT
jgi:hypothetical protein